MQAAVEHGVDMRGMQHVRRGDERERESLCLRQLVELAHHRRVVALRQRARRCARLRVEDAGDGQPIVFENGGNVIAMGEPAASDHQDPDWIATHRLDARSWRKSSVRDHASAAACG